MKVREVLKARAANAQAIFVRGIRQAGSALARNLTLLKRDRWRIAHSAMFDASWYRQQYPDVAASGVDPATHYLVFGAREGRNPHPSFDTKWYLGRYPDVAKSGINPLLHYLSIGQKEGRAPSPPGVPAAQRKSTFSEADDIALLKASPLFDAVWYLSEYGDVARAKADPVRHYLRHGAKEMRDPGPSFSTSWYLDKYRDVKRAGMNPLVHYLRYGQKEGRLPAPATAQRPWWEGLRPSSGTAASSVAFGETLTRLRKNALPPAVVVPVYNAAKEVDECLEALLTHTRGQARIIIIDDASPAPEVKEVLSRYEAEGSVEIYRNENNLGFTRTVNRGIELAGRADVVFLNSDTKVTPGWLLNLRVAAYSGEKIGTVTPLSNNAGAFSAPEIGKNNELPKWLTLDEYARAITQASVRVRPSTPTGNGFCMYVRRDCLDEIGALDADAFPRGYGEENDLCMRAVRKGWSHVVDDSTLIYHVRSASFGEAKTRLMADGRQVVDQRYPEYTGLVKKFVEGEPLKLARQRVQDIQNALADSKQVARPRILFVISTRTGGTPQTNQDLMQALDDRIEAFVLRCNATVLTLQYFREGVYTEVERHILAKPIKAFPHRSDEYDSVVGEWMVRYAIELVHVRHIGWHGLGLVEVVKTLGRPVVFSFHDFYTVCPTNKLLDNKNEYCGGVCTKSRGECAHELWPARGFPALKGAAISQWRTSMEEMLARCDAFITTAESAKEIISRTYPFLKERPFHVVPHGRDFEHFEKLAPELKAGEKIRILIPGNISVAKGGKIVEELGRRAATENLEIHLMGNVGSDLSLPAGVISHGVYAREKFAEKVREIRPHLGGVFSIWPETYCHTLTELWSCGLPVIAFDCGAVGERIKESGAGWLASEKSAESVIEIIKHLRQNQTEHSAVVSRVHHWQTTLARRDTCARMASSYYDVYGLLVALKGKDEKVRPASATSVVRPVDVDVVVPVFNALEDVKRCLMSLVRVSNSCRVNVIVVNDGSDSETSEWLRWAAARGWGSTASLQLIEHSQNQGYTKAVNTGLRSSTAPYVVTLNSDTIVTAKWLDGLIECMSSAPDIGIAGPLSNAASWQNVPELRDETGAFAVNELTGDMTPELMAEIVRRSGEPTFPKATFVNGFCFMIRREVIDAIGYMDEENFPVGYGEENDFCVRAQDAGFSLAIADNVYVYHAKSKSFGHDRRKELSRAGGETLRRKHTAEKFERLVNEMKQTETLDAIRLRVRELMKTTTADFSVPSSSEVALSQRVLFLLPARGGGGGAHSVVQEAAAMRAMGVQAQVLVKSRDLAGFLDAYPDIPNREEMFVGFESEPEVLTTANRFDVVVATLFSSVALLEKIVAAMPWILPAYYAQDYEPLFFPEGSSTYWDAWHSYTAIPNMLVFAKTDWIRREIEKAHGVRVEKVVPSIDHDVYRPAVSKSGDDRIHVTAMIRPSTPRRGPGRTMRLLKRLAQTYPTKIRVTIFGCNDNDPGFQDLSRDFDFDNAGVLKRFEVADLLRHSDVFVDLSDYQAFGRTALEAMACGSVAMVPKCGGCDEYAIDGVNALVVDTMNVDECFARIEGLVKNSRELKRMKSEGIATATRYSPRRAAMSELKLFAQALGRRRQLVFAPKRPKVTLMPAYTSSARDLAGSAYVRLVYPYLQSSMLTRFDYSIAEAGELPDPSSGRVFVLQRDWPTVDQAQFSVWAKEVQENGGKLIYEVDDDLLDGAALKDRGYTGDIAALAERVKTYVRAANLVTVSTEHLGDLLSQFNPNVRIVPNFIDGDLWNIEDFDGLKEKKSKGKLRIGYVGTPTHDQDLVIVKGAVDRIVAEFGQKVEVEVVGAFQTRTPLFGKRIGLPRRSVYPIFVEWLKQVALWDIAIIPLADSQFNRSKSNLKFLECAALGAAIVCSDTGDYRKIARHEENCLVAKNTTNDWYHALRRLIEDRNLREKLAQTSRTEVLEKYTVQNNQSMYHSVMNEVLAIEAALNEPDELRHH